MARVISPSHNLLPILICAFLQDFRTALLHLGIKLSDSAFRKLVEL